MKIPPSKIVSSSVLTLDSFESLADALNNQKSCLTIGVFDGVHIGHQALITRTVQAASALRIPAVAVSFSNHPLSVLAPPYAPRMLITPERKVQLIEGLGIDYLVLLDFTDAFAAIPAEQFVQRHLLEQAKMQKLVFGYDFTFGKGGKGTVELLGRLASDYSFDFESLSAVSSSNIEVKSTHIRDLLANGKITKANTLLTRPHEVPGIIVHGMKRGRTIGFPTANIEPPTHYQLPARGVYSAFIRIGAEPQLHLAMVNIGFSPTFGENKLTVEAHILNFHGEIHGRQVCLYIVSKLRDEKKFESVNDLVSQLKSDKQAVMTELQTAEGQATKSLVPPAVNHSITI